MKKKLTNTQWNIVGTFGYLLLKAIFATSKKEDVDFERVRHIVESRRFIAAIWHSRILAPCYLYEGMEVVTIASRSDDGEIIARILHRLGHEAVRGSTTHGGRQALAQLVRVVKGGKPAVITPDGPQGPRFRVQHGVIALARKTGLPVIPATYSAEAVKIFRSWDRFMLPRPFTRYRVIYGNPVYVPEDADANLSEDCRQRVEDELNRITRAADRRFGHRILED